MRLSSYCVVALCLSVNSAAHAFDCGFGVNCTLSEMANLLNNNKHLFNTSDYVYDDIYREGNSTIVFDQRLLVKLNKRERRDLKKQVVNKSAATSQICNTPDLRQMLDQGISLKYFYSDQNRNHINTFVMHPSDC